MNRNVSVPLQQITRYIVGWYLDETMTDDLVLRALRRAIQDRQPAPRLIHHSDRGGQYASRRYRALLQRAGMRQNMNREDNCYDHAFMESCFGTIKTELEMTEYQNYQVARREIGDYIEYCLRERKHSALDYLTAIQFEKLQPRRAGDSDRNTTDSK